MAQIKYDKDRLMSVGEVKKMLGTDYGRVCRNGRCWPVIGPDGNRGYFKSLIKMSMRMDREDGDLDDATADVVDRYENDVDFEDATDPETAEILARYEEDGAKSPARLRSRLKSIDRQQRGHATDAQPLETSDGAMEPKLLARIRQLIANLKQHYSAKGGCQCQKHK